jgi:hypothetical protein
LFCPLIVWRVCGNRGKGLVLRRAACLRHKRSTVWFDGTYGSPGRRRQRFKCVPGDGDKPHVFTEALPRQRTASGDCDHCERPLGKNGGLPAVRDCLFTAREIAAALVRVGEGIAPLPGPALTGSWVGAPDDPGGA